MIYKVFSPLQDQFELAVESKKKNPKIDDLKTDICKQHGIPHNTIDLKLVQKGQLVSIQDNDQYEQDIYQKNKGDLVIFMRPKDIYKISVYFNFKGADYSDEFLYSDPTDDLFDKVNFLLHKTDFRLKKYILAIDNDANKQINKGSLFQQNQYLQPYPTINRVNYIYDDVVKLMVTYGQKQAELEVDQNAQIDKMIQQMKEKLAIKDGLFYCLIRDKQFKEGEAQTLRSILGNTNLVENIEMIQQVVKQ